MGKSAKTFGALWGLCLFLVLACSESEFDQTATPGGGLLDVNEEFHLAVSWPVVTYQVGPTTTTILLQGNFIDLMGATHNMAVTLVVPNGVNFVPIDLSTTASAYNELLGGAMLFASTSVEGSIVIEEISGNGIRGSFEAVFEDANSDTRSIHDGNFVINSFDLKA